ncbi:PLP-dependent aminotransferase family protein [Paracoccus versutus]|uniref:GntR family transcriptional regulator n=1 Tax=Paracoccus versutus TaxID=34007 RepID=A0AAQ0KMW8_PARVE|nr:MULTISPECIES: PLP-dependent aminotransferase family protein [Paracoccus]WGR60510.1 PLP-dependent aminotransferase family protein [Paracoccus ferrooxidans]SFY28150.1 transcriptional regulator, GntR family [Paracoccus pantotrophus]KGJ12315.1 GntR family transcriptional regulator [Paracoccus versutus]MBT0780399.1 PLP-dependent aminotransferase family protein [Paracoccus sp. pheM1]REG48306.1 GntR family transcriptional regulator [Paracoccus versutus]
MTIWTPDPSALHRPAYLSLAEQYARAIRDGQLPAGTRLPPQRRLADDLGLSVQTVSRAYEELIRRGLVVGEVGRGSFVLPPGSENTPPYLAERLGELVDLSILKPVTERMHVETFREGLHWVAENLPVPAALSFRPNSVLPQHRQIAADWLRRKGIEAAPENITLTDGATSAITTAVMSAVPAGGTLAAAALTHHLLMPLCKYLGLHLEGLPVDEDGIVPEALDHLARKGSLRALYMQPAAINPMAIMSSAERRAELAAIARRHDLLIVENDMLNAMIPDRPPPMAVLAPERVLHINGFTKTTLPGLRVAWLLSPPRLASATANRHLVTNWMATPAMVELLSHWIGDGTVDRLILWQREALAIRHGIAREVLGAAPFRSHPQSLHIWLELPPGRDEEEFVAQARQRGVAVASGRAFRLSERGRRDAVRIALGSTGTEELRRGLALVAETLGGSAEPLLPLI